MHLVELSGRLAGERLARSVTAADGRVLLRAGTVLTPRYLARLGELGWRRVFVAEPGAAPEALAARDAAALATLAEVAAALRAAAAGTGDGPQRLAAAVARLTAALYREPALGQAVAALGEADAALAAHARDVAVHALRLGAALPWPAADLVVLGLGALLHDVGRLSAPRRSPEPPGHAAAGFAALRRLGCDLRAAHVAYQHHERPDGRGYPRGLPGRRISPFAAVVAVADAYDGLLRTGVAPQVAMRLLHVQAGSALDDQLVRLFTERVRVYPTGACVLLASGEVAVVAAQSPDGFAWPRLRVIAGPGLVPVSPFEAEARAGREIVRVLPTVPATLRARLRSA